ncbi:MAG TPA: hypothetical protein VKB51_08410 [bacterium]|nr:hypothetical protein [bacterium]
MNIETYFGFFAQSVMMAVGTSLTSLTGSAVTLERVELSTTNTLKLRWSDVETVLLPQLAAKAEVPFVFALTEHDVAGLTRLAGERMPFHKLLEQVVSTAAEPFNFIGKRRNRLTGLQVSRNVTGFTAHHLGGEVSYTMATGVFTVPRGNGFVLRLLVTAAGRDLIEERATQKATQRALFSINEGAYLCRPQWEPPPPPPGLEQGAQISELMLAGWLQTFFGRNDGEIGNRLFQRPAGLQCQVVDAEAMAALVGKDGPPTVARLQLGDEKALELFVVLPAAAAGQLIRLSRSGQERFLGDMFRALFADSAKLWEAFAETPMRWRLLAARKIPSDAIDAVTKRLEGGGLIARQTARMDEGYLEWVLAIPPHTWHWLMRITAKGMALPAQGLPNRQAIFRATGWAQGRVPWARMAGFLSDRELQDLIRVMGQAGLAEPVLASVAEALDGPFRQRWLEAMPVMLRERTERYELAEGEAQRRHLQLTRTLIGLHRAHKLPQGRLALWVALYTEYYFSRCQYLIDTLLPLRHLVYGMDRASLSRLLFDARGNTLVHMLSWAEFPVVDQVRRAISPGFALHLFEDVGELRSRITAFAAQQAQLDFYRSAFQGMTQGRYMVRATPAQRLRDLIRLLDEET